MADRTQARIGFYQTMLSGISAIELAALEREVLERLIASGLTITDAGVMTFAAGKLSVSADNLSGTLSVGNGGTGATSLTDGGVLLGSGTGAITALAVLGDGVIVIGDGSGDPTTLDVGSSSSITILGTIATGVWNGTAVTVPYGGTGATSFTDGGLLLGSGAGAITALGAASNGQIPIGDGAGDPQLANITGTTNEVDIANGSASIQVGLPASVTITTALTISGTGASSLDVGGGINAGTGNVALVGTDGKINGPLSSTIIDDLSGVNLTTLNASNLSSGTAGTARLGSGTASSATFLRGDSSWAAPSGGALDPTTQVFTSGSGTYTTPDNCATIRVRLVGGGGGAGAASSNAGAAGGNTTFAASTMQGTGGGAGGHGASTGGAGGTGGAAANGLVNVRGSDGSGGGDDTAAPGAPGGSSYFGGGGAGGVYTAAGVNAGGVGSGGGGAGATSGATNSSGGGGAGGYCERLIDNPDETYDYAVGAAGAGGAAGTDAGGNGSAGLIVVEEYYA